ncbi:MAG: hypothetical protein JWN10_2347 [Solirubrobacterales bacterium]|nr:hypothetical protein [Solirubrobacterales bacterium]
MLGRTQNPSNRTLAKGLLCAGVIAMALLLTLAAGASANAAESVVPPTASGGSTPEPTPGSTTPLPAALEPASSEPASAETTTPGLPVVEVTPPPVVEVVTPPVVPVAPVVPAPEPAPPAEAKTPLTELVPSEATSPSKPVAEGGPVSAEPIAATAAEAALSVAAPSTGQIAAGLTSPPAATPQTAMPPDAATVEASSVLLGRLAVGAAGRSPRPPSGPGAAAAAAGVPVVGLSAAQRAAELSCELSGMARTVTDDCRAGWLSAQISLSTPIAGFRAATGSRTGPPDDGYGGSLGGSHPIIPAPAPAPSGAVGGSAAGGSGVALSGFFTLAGLLLLAAPRALRRLRLSCQPWRTAFFVLIPERPG